MSALATRIEDVARGLAVPGHRAELEAVARELRELGPSAPANPLEAFDAAIAAAENADPREPAARQAWSRAITYGIRALVDQRSPVLLGEAELKTFEPGERLAPFPRTSPEAPAFPLSFGEPPKEATVDQLKATAQAALEPGGDGDVGKECVAELRKRAESPARDDRQEASAALSELAVQVQRMGGPEIKPPPGETIPAEALGGLTVDELVAVLRNDVETYRFAGQVEIPAAIAELAKRDLSDWPHDLTEEEAAAVASAAERGESSG